MRPSDIAARAKRLCIPQSRLAVLAGLDKNTVGRALKHSDDAAGGPYRSTCLKLELAIASYERDTLAHLARLHPDKVIELSTVALCGERQAAPARNAA